MILALLTLERTGVLPCYYSPSIALLTSQTLVIFPVQPLIIYFLSDSASGSEKYHLFPEHIVPHLASFCFPASLCAYINPQPASMPFLVILHFPADSFFALLCSLLQEADLDSLCHLKFFFLWILVGVSQWEAVTEDGRKKRENSWGIYSSCSSVLMCFSSGYALQLECPLSSSSWSLVTVSFLVHSSLGW